MVRRSLLSFLALGASGLAIASETLSLSTATLSSFSNTSAPVLLSKTALISQSLSSLTPSTIPQAQSPPDSNSRGDYVTTRYTTQHPTYTLPLGFTETEPFGPSGVVIVGPTSWVTQDVLPVVDVANDLNTIPSARQPWDPVPFLSGENKTILTDKASFISYGREPACTSAFNAYAAANPSTTYTAKAVGTITLSNGQTTKAVVYSTITWPMTTAPHCCGTCSLYFNNLQMLYWPASHPNTACLVKPSASLNGTSTRGVVAARDQSLYVTDSDGYVYTSPSIYVRFPTVSASDACGFIGSALTSVTLAFSPGELSTFVWELYMSTSTQTYTSALDTADLPCGPWNGTDKFLPEPWSNYSSYQPLIVLPSKLVNMVPAWKSCTADMFEGQDPPRALTPAAAMAPTPTDAETDPQGNPAFPSPPIVSLPRNTGAANLQPTGSSPTLNPPPEANDPSVGASGDPSTPYETSKPNDPSENDPGDSSDHNPPSKASDSSTAESGGSSDDNIHPTPNAPSTDDPGVSNGDLPQKPNAPSTQGPGGSSSHNWQSSPVDPSTGGSGDSSDPQVPAAKAVSQTPSPASDPTPSFVDDLPPHSLSNPSTADPQDITNTPPTFPPAVILQGHTITQGAVPVTVSRSPVVYQSGSISAGGEIAAVPTGWGQSNEAANPVTLGGLVFSAVPSPTKANGDPHSSNDYSTNAIQINDPAANSPDPATYINVGGQTIAVDADGINVAGTTLKPGDPGITIDGTPISLGSSIFVVGTRTESLSSPPATITAQPSHITVGSKIMSVGSGAITIDGTTLKPADPGITVDGTLVSLGSSVLVVGSHTQNLVLSPPTPTALPSYMTIGGETIAVAAGSIIIAGHTMTPGGPAETADGTLVSLGSSILVVGTQTVSFTLPTASGANVMSSEGIGAMIIKGLGGLGAGTVAAPTQTAGSSNGTRVGNVTMVFTGGAREEGVWRFKWWFAWVWFVPLVVV